MQDLAGQSKLSGPIRSVTAWLSLVLLCNGLWLLLLRLFLDWGAGASDATANGFFAGFPSRYVSSPFYGFMGATFFGSIVFGVALWAAVALTNQKLARRFAGIAPGADLSRPSAYASARAPLRDAAALFPGLGFLGTVIGVSLAIGGLRNVIDGGDPGALIDGLRTAFDTTFMGLVASLALSVVLMLCDQAAARDQLENL